MDTKPSPREFTQQDREFMSILNESQRRRYAAIYSGIDTGRGRRMGIAVCDGDNCLKLYQVIFLSSLDL